MELVALASVVLRSISAFVGVHGRSTILRNESNFFSITEILWVSNVRVASIRIRTYLIVKNLSNYKRLI